MCEKAGVFWTCLGRTSVSSAAPDLCSAKRLSTWPGENAGAAALAGTAAWLYFWSPPIQVLYTPQLWPVRAAELKEDHEDAPCCVDFTCQSSHFMNTRRKRLNTLGLNSVTDLMQSEYKEPVLVSCKELLIETCTVAVES